MSGIRKVSDIEGAKAYISGDESGVFSSSSVDVRAILSADLKECEKSREQVALDLSEIVGTRITLAMIDAMVAPTKANRFPAEWIPAWIRVTGSERLFRELCGAAGLFLGSEEDRDFAELGRARLKAEKLERKLWARY